MDTRTIPLTQGLSALVDEADYEALSRHKWCAHQQSQRCYAVRNALTASGWTTVGMHRVVLNAPAGLEVDHVNGNGLDNRRANLRVATTAQNQHNRQKRRGKCRYKGVIWDATRGRWRPRIVVSGRHMYLGIFADPIDAALAYDLAAIANFGEFACPNFLRRDHGSL